MNIKEKTKELDQNIQEFRKGVTALIQRLSFESEEFEDLKRKFDDIYIPKLSKKIDIVIDALNSPVSVGLIGRYSHGKTALLNRIFSIPQDYGLPEGEGIVTSKITRVDFKERLSFPRAYIVKTTKDKEEISLKELVESVGPSTSIEPDEDTSIIDYYHLELPAIKGFSVLFARNNIAIVDMPGIGGRYFKDKVLTRETLELMDFILVVIKMTEIDKAGRAVEPVIAGIKNIPMIPVFTFFDEAKESVVYTDCKDEEEIIEKAKELAKEHLPSIAKWIPVRSVFVSNKDGTNISQLRETIINFVEERMSPIPKKQQQKPELFKKKIYEIRNSLVDLVSFLNKFVNDISNEIEKNKPSAGKKTIKVDLSQVGKSELRGIKLRAKDIIREHRNEIEGKISSLMMANNESQFKQYLSELDTVLQQLSNRLEMTLQTEFADTKNSLKAQIEKVLSRKINLPDDRMQELLYEIFDVIDGYVLSPSFVDDLKDIDLMRFSGFKSPKIDIIRRILNSLSDPKFFLTLLISVILIKAGSVHIPLIGNLGFLKYLGFLGMGGALLFFVYDAFISPPPKRFFEREKAEKIRDIRKVVSELLTSINDSIIKDIESSLEEIRDEILTTISEFTDVAYSDYKKNKSIINDIKKEKEKLQKEIELFSESLGIELIS